MKQLRNTIRTVFIRIRTKMLKLIWGYQLSDTTRISFSAHLDKANPTGIKIGDETLIAHGAIILSHDYSRGLKEKTTIGSNCMIGVNSIILPGITIGDQVLIGAGSVVTKNIESNTLAAGNPAKVLKRIKTGAYGKILETYETINK